jgi:hypothetical protein
MHRHFTSYAESFRCLLLQRNYQGNATRTHLMNDLINYQTDFVILGYELRFRWSLLGLEGTFQASNYALQS